MTITRDMQVDILLLKPTLLKVVILHNKDIPLKAILQQDILPNKVGILHNNLAILLSKALILLRPVILHKLMLHTVILHTVMVYLPHRHQ
jgi:hypothetical protein